LNSFRVLEGKEEKKAMNAKEIENFRDITQNYAENTIFLTETHFTKNIHKVFPDAPKFFGKMLYIYMSKGYDRVKISLLRYMESLWPLVNPDQRFNHNKIAFDILDLDRDKNLNILNMMHLQKNLDPNSIIGKDVFKLIKFFIDKFLSKKGSSGSHRQSISYENFTKILGRCCLIDQVAHCVFGMEGVNTQNIFTADKKHKFEYDYMFQDINVFEDVSYGQRGFIRNLDGLLALMIQYLNRY